MSSNSLKRLAQLLAGLLVIWVGLTVWRRSSRDVERRFELPRFDRRAINGAIIARTADTMRLARSGGGWTANGFRASDANVEQLLDAMADTAAQTELIAESKTSHERLGVDSAKARRVTLQQGDKTAAEILVGSRGGSYESAYVRKPGDDAVYQIKGRLNELAERPLDDWRDKRVVTLQPDSILGIEVQAGKQGYQLTRSGGGWTVNGAPADSAAMVALLNQFRELIASGFATKSQIDSASFVKPDKVVRLSGRTGSLVVLSFDSTAAGFWGRRDGDSTTYKFESWAVNQLAPAESTLRQKAPAAAPAPKP